MHPGGKNNKIFLILFIVSLSVILSAPVFAAVNPVAKLSAFSGTVFVKSQGEWGVELRADLPLYSNDKVVTKDGSATITFDDGSVMELRANSNLLIYTKERAEGIFQRTRVIERRLRLIIGKMLFRTGKSDTSNILETGTMVCGLRGTAGTISIDAQGVTHLQFTEGSFSYVNGEFIPDSVAADLPEELASMNPAQRAAFVAAAAADQAKKAAAAAQAAAGTPQEAQALAQAAYNAARAAELAAEEVKVQANIMLANNPDPDVIEQVNEAISEANSAIAEAQEAQRESIDRGAVREAPGTFIMPTVPAPVPTPGFDVPVAPEVPIQDTEPASPV